jgi:hypothetical protein
MESLKDRLSCYCQIKLTVVGRKSGTAITNPVWFVAKGDTLGDLGNYQAKCG